MAAADDAGILTALALVDAHAPDLPQSSGWGWL